MGNFFILVFAIPGMARCVWMVFADPDTRPWAMVLVAVESIAFAIAWTLLFRVAITGSPHIAISLKPRIKATEANQ